MPLETPTAYRPFVRLLLCSNTFVNTRVPFAAGTQPILLVGSGQSVPLVWLAARRAPNDPSWLYVVVESRSTHPVVSVVADPERRGVTISVAQRLVLAARATTEHEAIVERLDLRPVGLNVFGDGTGLSVGTNRLVGNVLQGVEVGIDFGPPPPATPSGGSPAGR